MKATAQSRNQVRTHPVTLLKSLNYNPTFIERIEELREQESNHILAFLREHLLNADDLTVRWKWTPGAVAFWDNRSVVHKAVPGGYNVTLREGKRTAVYGERPFWDPEHSESLSQRAERLAKESQVNGNGHAHVNGQSGSEGGGLGPNGSF
jgi:sulfonate dioxygenase